MDSYEIMTAVRNLSRLHSENELPERELLRNINLAYSTVCSMMLPLFKQDLVETLTVSSQTGDYSYPKDVLLLVNVYRKNASSVYKLANRLEPEQKPLIGTVNYPEDQHHPLYVQMGSILSFTPALSSTDIRLEYRKRIAPLCFGIGSSAADGSYITLNNDAPIRDDVLNSYWLALYKLTDGIPILRGVVKITDYVGSSRQATCSCPDNSQAYYYALVPVLPDEFHHFIVDMTLVFLALADYYKKDAAVLRKQVIDSMIMTLKMNGIEYEVEGK